MGCGEGMCGVVHETCIVAWCYLITAYKDTNVNLLELCATKGCVIIGWIHNRTTSETFLRSNDQHMQATLQVTQPKAVAVVLDKHDTPFYYRMTEHGMDVCRNCAHAQAGLHEHDQSAPLFQEAAVNVHTGGKRSKVNVYNEADQSEHVCEEPGRKAPHPDSWGGWPGHYSDQPAAPQQDAVEVFRAFAQALFVLAREP